MYLYSLSLSLSLLQTRHYMNSAPRPLQYHTIAVNAVLNTGYDRSVTVYVITAVPDSVVHVHASYFGPKLEDNPLSAVNECSATHTRRRPKPTRNMILFSLENGKQMRGVVWGSDNGYRDKSDILSVLSWCQRRTS